MMLDSLKKWGWFAVETVFIVPLSVYRGIKFELGLAKLARTVEHARRFGPKLGPDERLEYIHQKLGPLLQRFSDNENAEPTHDQARGFWDAENEHAEHMLKGRDPFLMNCQCRECKRNTDD